MPDPGAPKYPLHALPPFRRTLTRALGARGTWVKRAALDVGEGLGARPRDCVHASRQRAPFLNVSFDGARHAMVTK